MADGAHENKTEAPTPRRRDQAREEGQVLFSPDFSGAVILMLVAVSAIWFIPMIAAQLQTSITSRLTTLSGDDWGVTATVIAARWMAMHLWAAVGASCLLVLSVGMVLSQVQSGFAITVKPLSPNWERLSPVQGFQKLWSADSMMRGLLAGLKVGSLVAVSAALTYVWRHALRHETLGTLEQSIGAGWAYLTQVLLGLAGVALFWGLADLGFRFWRHEQKLRMSREELKEEFKEQQGDPQLRSRMRRMQKEAAQRKTLQEVPAATAVLTNPTHYAVALKYEPGRMKAPQVVAKGSGAFARKIAEVARAHGVPVLERKPLARALYALAEVGQEIPVELYRAVAEILAYVYRLKNRVKGG